MTHLTLFDFDGMLADNLGDMLGFAAQAIVVPLQALVLRDAPREPAGAAP